MPHVANTPESLLPRSDSKNPASTCKGITSNGRPCRRALAGSPASSPGPSPGHSSGTHPGAPLRKCSDRSSHPGAVAFLQTQHKSDSELLTAAFFCWQHRDQAIALANQIQNANAKSSAKAKKDGRKTIKVVDLNHRSSIDTLISRLGILESGNDGSVKKGREVQKGDKEGTSNLLGRRRKKEGSSISARQEPDLRRQRSDHTNNSWSRPTEQATRRKASKRRGESNLLLSFLCCVHSDRNPEPSPPNRPQKPLSHIQTSHTSQHPNSRSNNAQKSPADTLQRPFPTSLPPPSPQFLSPISRTQSQTQALLAMIPPSISPQTTALLLAELAKPISKADNEEGYIYMFWLTPASSSTSTSTATLTSPSSSQQPGARLAAELLSTPPTTPGNSTEKRNSSILTDRPNRQDPATSSLNQQDPNNVHRKKKTLLLKIGRAQNVHRRLSQWTKQCGHELSLVRYYPHPPHYSSTPSTNSPFPPSPLSPSPLHHPSPSSPSPSPSHPSMKIPHPILIERLIHIELASKRVLRDCSACGRCHREWFEIEASREGLRGVDDVVRRWVGFGLGNGIRNGPRLG
ncbi:hypothetical protein MMC09_006058 [Bachmanniomyces sp. S44760]|nr:hypothetical protein [Bachmanniomyces sp. S44760]